MYGLIINSNLLLFIIIMIILIFLVICLCVCYCYIYPDGIPENLKEDKPTEESMDGDDGTI